MKKLKEKCADKIADKLMSPVTIIKEDDYSDKKAFKDAMDLWSKTFDTAIN